MSLMDFVKTSITYSNHLHRERLIVNHIPFSNGDTETELLEEMIMSAKPDVFSDCESLKRTEVPNTELNLPQFVVNGHGDDDYALVMIDTVLEISGKYYKLTELD